MRIGCLLAAFCAFILQGINPASFAFFEFHNIASFSRLRLSQHVYLVSFLSLIFLLFILKIKLFSEIILDYLYILQEQAQKKLKSIFSTHPVSPILFPARHHLFFPVPPQLHRDNRQEANLFFQEVFLQI